MSAEELSKMQAPPQVRQQIQLPWSKAWQISIKSIKIRLGRSLITACGIFLGISFYGSVRAVALFPISGNTSAEALAALHRQQWLAVMALLVCFFGIMNAMLMSVTERFKEIGTMKCLGALDSFVVRLFFIEAILMGVFASFAGWLAGWLIITLVHLISDGVSIFGGSFWSGTLWLMVQSTLIGTLITLVAAIPPAVRAAQMPPAVALRSEI
ncbi:MAG TPA: FtsX-like permease family protein [Chthonomonadaceae bacterium]|nr:FtsX-like permease family protein [Chthonomonadaceae bacterium]